MNFTAICGKTYIFVLMNRRKRNICIWVTGIVILMLAAWADVMNGGVASGQVLWHLRTPRVLTSLLAGAALALAGAQMQSVLRNPLADPHIMGVSAGASLGAALATMFTGRSATASPQFIQGLSVASAAFAGAILSAVIILVASRRFRKASTLLIFGVMLGFIASAVVTILQFTSSAESLKLFYSWSAGSFSNAGWTDICILASALVTGLCIAVTNTKGLDIILFGDEFATMAGAPVHKIRLSAIVSCSLITAAATAFCGPLGFVGIVAPHIARGIFRTSTHRMIIPASLLTGAMIGLISDLISQTAPAPLPIASTMAIVGIPIVIYILAKGGSYGE